MSHRKRREAMRQASRRLAKTVADLDQELDSRRLEALDVGDLVIDDRAAAAGFQWAIIDRSGGRFRLVPADARSDAMPGDHPVREETSGTRLLLRCHHAVWIPAFELAAAERTGRLDDADCRRARELADDAITPPSESSTDDLDPELRAWIVDVIGPVVAPMRDADPLGMAEDPEPPTPFPVAANSHVPGTESPPGRTGHRALALAAALLVGLGLGWIGQRVGAPQGSISVEGVDEQASHGARGLTMAFLRPRETLRGPVDAVVRLGSHEPRFALALGLDTAHLVERYRLQILDEAGQAVVEPFEMDRDDRLVLGVELPSRLFQTGRYQVFVQPIGAGSTEARYGFEIVEADAGSQSP